MVDDGAIQSKRLKSIVSKMSSSARTAVGDDATAERRTTSTATTTTATNTTTQTESFEFEDSDGDDIDSALLEIKLPTASSRTSNPSKTSRHIGSSAQAIPNQTASTLPYIDDTDVPSKRVKWSTKANSQTSSRAAGSSSVSRNEHVQAMKVSNLVKAAEESLRPAAPYLAIQNVGNMVWNRMRGKSKRIKTNNRSNATKRSKTTASLLEQVNNAKAKSSVQSSDSDSDN